MPRVSASAAAVTRPTRRPVNGPGPSPATVAVRGPGDANSGYAYDEPRGWDHDVSCGGGSIGGVPPGSCTKPDSAADAGVYLFARSVAVGRTDAGVAGALAGQVTGLQPCA